MARKPPIVVASNRGPVAFTRAPDGTVEQRRGVGGLVTAVGGALRGREAAWVAAAITEGDREQAARGPFEYEVGGTSVRVRLAALEEKLYSGYYSEFSNRILWFLHHYLWDTPRAPEPGPAEDEAWDSYVTVNERFAELAP